MQLGSWWRWVANKVLSFKAPCYRVRSPQKPYFPCCFSYIWVTPRYVSQCSIQKHSPLLFFPHSNTNKHDVYHFQQISVSFQIWFLRWSREIMRFIYRKPIIYNAKDWLSHHTKLCYKGVTNTPGKCWFARTFIGLSVCHCKNWDTVTVTS